MAASQPPAFQKFARRGGLQVPPAIFPPVMGLFGLGLAWRWVADAIGFGGAAAEALLGAVSLLFVFCAGAYLAKVRQRPGVVAEDLKVLPGRAGLAAANLSGMLLAATLVPYAPGVALAVLGLAMLSHLLLGATILRAFLRGPEEARVITPVWHLVFVGWILAPLSLIPLGFGMVATAILYLTIPVAGAIWAISARQLATRIPPAPLRPLLAIHLAPASLFATISAMLGMDGFATAFVLIAALILIGLLAASVWITQAGFSALWGAFTFPAAACASAFLASGWAVPGVLVAVGASAITFPVAVKVMQAWAKGGLAAKTNAAQA